MAPVTKLYIVRKEGDRWCVYPKSGGDALGCHDTEEGAQKQLAAIEASKAARTQGEGAAFAAYFTALPDATIADAMRVLTAVFAEPTGEVGTIRGVEIFATGTHNGDEYGEADLDEMVASFPHLGYKPPLKQGHGEGQRAYGWVENLRRAGSKLLADFVDVPKKVIEEIREKGWGPVSAEVFWDLERAGTTFKRALKAVALLGGDVPAVPGLKPVYENLAALKYAGIKAYTHQPPRAYWISRAGMATICAPCAEKMAALNLSRVRLALNAEGQYAIENIPPQMLQGLCEHFGASEGFRTRCMESSFGGEFAPTDRGAFCNALKDACGMMAQRGDDRTTISRQEFDRLVQYVGALVARLAGGQSMAQHQVKERNGEFCVFAEGSEEPVACYPTRAEAEARVSAMSQKDAKTPEQQIADLQAQAAESKRLVEAAQARVATIEGERRAERITAKVAGLKLPALRPHVKALLHAVAGEAKVVKFAQADGKEADTAPEAVVDAMITALNGLTDRRIFAELSVHERNGDPYDDASKEVDRRVQEYLSKNPTVKEYDVAQAAVLTADPALKEAYASRT